MILKKISIEFSNNCLNITFDEELTQTEEFKTYKKNVYDTEKWLNVEVKPLNRRCVNEIKIFVK